MTHEIAKKLREVVDAAAGKLKAISEESARRRPAPGKWSVQEIVGHLIDSATNNHHRFIRAQETDKLVFPKYEQDHWVNAQHYNEASWPEVVELWRLYNRHLAHVIENVPQDKLETICIIGAYEPVTLKFLIEDYLVHLEHHLRQVEQRQNL